MEETTDQPGHGARVYDYLKTGWRYRPVKILCLVIFPLTLYVADLLTDFVLAGQYYNSGDYTWFGLTLAFVLGPGVIINIISAVDKYIFDDEEGKLKNHLEYSMHVLLLGVFVQYFDFFLLLLRGRDTGNDLKRTHLFEATLECIPQLCLQLYIIVSTGERVSVLKVISMVISLLAAIKAVVTYLYSQAKGRTFSGRFVTKVVLLIIWKAIELSVRVLAIALFASAFKAWIALPIGVHWLTMTITYTYAWDTHRISMRKIFEDGLIMAVDTFSMTFSFDFSVTFWVNTVLTLLGNATMVAVWFGLKAGQDWYDVPAVAGVVAGSLGSAVLGAISRLV